MPPLGRQTKRSKAGEARQSQAEAADVAEGIELVELQNRVQALELERHALFTSIDSNAIYDMQAPGEKDRLGRDLWTRDLGADLRALRAANSELVAMLRAQISNTSDVTEGSLRDSEREIDGILLDICRAQNMFKIPMLTAALSILGELNKVPREYHDALSKFHRGAATAENWVISFLPVAMAQRPPPDFETILGVAVCCFDNLSMQVDYKSYSSQGETGRKLNMTTWFSTLLPRHLAPLFDALATCARQSPSNFATPPLCMHVAHTDVARCAQEPPPPLGPVRPYISLIQIE